jgi:hypothetical protein
MDYVDNETATRYVVLHDHVSLLGRPVTAYFRREFILYHDVITELGAAGAGKSLLGLDVKSWQSWIMASRIKRTRLSPTRPNPHKWTHNSF